MSTDSQRVRPIQWRLFLAAWLAYAFFHQGGGWNQNTRFAMIRAVVEEGRFAVDSFLIYRGPEPGADRALRRATIVDGGFAEDGRDYVLAWPGGRPVRPAREGEQPVQVQRLGSTGDLAYSRGSFFPNKAPGAALIGVPAYFVIHGLEKLLGLDPDAWWILTMNAWLTTGLGVGLISALGVALFFRVTLELSDHDLHASTWAAIAFAAGTLFFPYATVMFEHNVAAVGLLGGFRLFLLAPRQSSPYRRRLFLFCGGVVAGWSAISTYIAFVPILLLLAGVWYRGRRVSDLPWIGLGLSVPLAIVMGYHQACFGTPFTTSYHFQNPQFQETDAFLKVLERPRLERLVGVLISPFRGIFFSSPVLLLGAAGLIAWFRRPERRIEALLFGGIFGFFLLFNVCFNGWHGGWGIGPRYLVPGLPFLAIPMVWGFRRVPRTTRTLALLSIVMIGLMTAVDAQPPVGTSGIAKVSGRARLLREPLTEYALPIFFTGLAQPILESQVSIVLGTDEETAARATLLRTIRQRTSDFPLAAFVGPVSANPIGVYEGWIGHLFRPEATEARWNSFNAGELLLPHSRLSLLFLLLTAGPLAWMALGLSHRGSVRESSRRC